MPWTFSSLARPGNGNSDVSLRHWPNRDESGGISPSPLAGAAAPGKISLVPRPALVKLWRPSMRPNANQSFFTPLRPKWIGSYGYALRSVAVMIFASVAVLEVDETARFDMLCCGV